MTVRAVKSLTEFAFRNDFAPPDRNPDRHDEPGTLRLSAGELASLLAEARAEGADAERARDAARESERLEAVSARLRQALEELLRLAECLDQAALPDDAARDAKALMASACQQIVDGQGDLFANR